MGRKIFNKCDFIKKANEVHNNYYDYSEFIYVKSNVKGIIICPNHGSFLQRSNSHLSGSGCKKCKVGRRHTEQTKEKMWCWNMTVNIIKEKHKKKKIGSDNKKL